MPEQYPNNSQRRPEEIATEVDKQIEAVIAGDAITRKPSGFRRLRQSFIGGDSKSVSEHVFWNMLVPAAKDTLSDMGSTFIDMMIFGERRSRVGGVVVPKQGMGSTSKFNYSGITTGSQLIQGHQQHVQLEPTRFSPNEIIVGTRSEAEAIITRMFEVLEKYHVVTVADLYRMIRKSPNYMDDKWGWTNLDGADVKRVRGGGMLLILPNPEDLN